MFYHKNNGPGKIFPLQKWFGNQNIANLSDLVTELAGLEYPVYIGGPVEQNQLYYLHNHAEVEDAFNLHFFTIPSYFK